VFFTTTLPDDWIAVDDGFTVDDGFVVDGLPQPESGSMIEKSNISAKIADTIFLW
jgi:hypothetical protein